LIKNEKRLARRQPSQTDCITKHTVSMLQYVTNKPTVYYYFFSLIPQTALSQLLADYIIPKPLFTVSRPNSTYNAHVTDG